MNRKKSVQLSVGGVEYTVSPEDVGPETTLNEYLREKLHLTGTKRMCLEGGCGTCTVAVEETVNGKKKIFSVNSCLVSIMSCHGWTIHTIEGIGNPLNGYHTVQKTLADNYGTQCGFCSPGMVMNMFALQSSGQNTKAQIENSFGGNICRCTGYRPILNAFKTLAVDKEQLPDIEELKLCKNDPNKICTNDCKPKDNFYLELKDSRWIKVHTLRDLLEVIKISPTNNYMLVCGNTARGVYRDTRPANQYIDVREVAELTRYYVNPTALKLGANIVLTDFMSICTKVSANPGFEYLKTIVQHVDLVATVQIRNVGSLAGNLMIKYRHNEFPSDIFLLLETFNASIRLVDVDGNESFCTPQEFLRVDMTRRVIKNIILSTLDSSYKYATYKMMPRAQNAHAMVNAGFLVKLKNNVVTYANIVYGGINPQFIHASKTEKFLIQQNLYKNDTLQKAFNSLKQELIPDWVLPDPTPEFRKNLAISLFYKFVLKTSPPNLVGARYKSGGTILTRALSTGVQQYGTDNKQWPLTQPIPKVESLAQTSGQIKYILDMPDIPHECHASFVTAKCVAGSKITNVDVSQALKIEGYVGYVDKKDIPGRNTCTPLDSSMGWSVEEELFCSGIVQYYNQPVGLVIAKTAQAAHMAASLVQVKYTPPQNKYYLDVREVVADNVASRIHHVNTVLPRNKGYVGYVDKKDIPGRNTCTPLDSSMGWSVEEELFCSGIVQYYNQPVGLVIAKTAQAAHMAASLVQVKYTPPQNKYYLDVREVVADNVASRIHHVNTVLPRNKGRSKCLNDENHTNIFTLVVAFLEKINVKVTRLGGAFGAKILRNNLISAAAAVAAHKLQIPIKLVLTFEQNMDIIGMRFPSYMKYKVGVNDTGVIQYLEADVYCDVGVGGNEPFNQLFTTSFENCYNMDSWEFSTYDVKTDTPANCYTRAPGTVEATAEIENIMEHIAFTLNISPDAVKQANNSTTSSPKMPSYWTDLKSWANIDQRKADIEKFNAANRWNKRGLSIVPMRWVLDVNLSFSVLVSIFHRDGGVAISHGGIEIGQGINTKVIQVAAYKFGIDMDKISIKPSYNFITPNNGCTGGSLTSEAICYAVIVACDKLLAKMKPVKDKMNNPSWVDLIQACHAASVQLCDTGFYHGNAPNVQPYPIFGICATEVEVDILTGQHQILQVDIIEDLGQSMSPLIDIGQIEGAFVMGIGYYTTEELIYDKNGKLYTNRTWNYKPPGAKDIPINFRVKFAENSINPVGVLKSKAVAEPPICLSVALAFAIRNALYSARKEADPTHIEFLTMNGPTTVERTFLYSKNNYQQYVLQ
uniref:Xanthine dehydrogenase-like n=1 Tax=Diabrotica virgifera virgifera TaxID=50390 RepID=A0A6P7EZ01_DIAVI